MQRWVENPRELVRSKTILQPSNGHDGELSSGISSKFLESAV